MSKMNPVPKLIFQYKFHLLLFIISFLILTKFNIDPDLGWHLAYGQKFLQEGRILRVDEFSWTMPGYEWGNSYFMFQILTAFLFQKFGHLSSAIIFGIIAAFSVLMLLPKKLNFWAILIVGLGSLIALANAGIRPHITDLPFLALLLYLLDKEKFRNRNYIPLWFVFFAIWANFHVGFFFGLLIFAAMIVIDLASQIRSKKRISILIGGLSIAAAFIGTLLTPFHFQMWKSIFFDSAGLVGWRSIQSLQSTAIFMPYNFLLALSGIIFIFVLRSKINKIKPAWLIISSFLFAFVFFVVDFVYLWVAMFIFLGTRHFRINLDLKSDLLTKISLFFPLTAVILAFFLVFVVNFLESWTLNERLRKDRYPVDAVKFLTENNLDGNLFNDYAWGGYINWQAPQIKVFIDGRFAGWVKSDGSSFLADYLAILKGQCSVFEKYEIKTVLVSKNFNVSCLGNFKKIYEDDSARIFALHPVQ